MMSSNARWGILLLVFALPLPGQAEDWQYGGHVKYQFTASQYSSDNILAIANTASPLDHYFDLRLKADRKTNRWSYSVHYEILGLYGDTVKTLASLPSLPSSSIAPTDSKRLFNLTQSFGYSDRLAGVHRIDRAVAGFADNQLVMRFGRQAISWGNGLFFNPMDLVNPFSPTAISKEYKTGEDMVYGQWLYDNGNDVQGILLPRRNTVGEVDFHESSYALKYRGIRNQVGYDLLIAAHYGESVAGIGLSTDVNEAVVRLDLVNSWLVDGSHVISAIINTSYSWTWDTHNVSGNLEYYRNGVGRADGNYSAAFLATSNLGKRVLRGEVFGLGQDYLAGSLTIEMTPRVIVTPTWLHNLNDSSGIVQTLLNFDWKQNVPVIVGLGLPYGARGSEFGGIQTSTPGQYYGPGITAFAQMGFYF